MLQHLKRPWNYLADRLPGRVEQTTDPKVELMQAISEAMEKHRRLREHAAKVIANQKQTETRLNRSIDELEQATSDTQSAELTADRLVALELAIESLKSLHFQASEAADQAKTAVAQNATALQQKLSARQSVLGRLDQAKTQEQVDAAMQSLSEGIGQDVPTFDEVREQIDARYAAVKGTAEEIRSRLGVDPGETPAGSARQDDQIVGVHHDAR